jgi:hypothetical protein
MDSSPYVHSIIASIRFDSIRLTPTMAPRMRTYLMWCRPTPPTYPPHQMSQPALALDSKANGNTALPASTAATPVPVSTSGNGYRSESSPSTASGLSLLPPIANRFPFLSFSSHVNASARADNANANAAGKRGANVSKSHRPQSRATQASSWCAAAQRCSTRAVHGNRHQRRDPPSNLSHQICGCLSSQRLHR